MKNKIYIILITLSILFLLKQCINGSIDVEKSKNNGDKIIAALEKYYNDKEKYPFSLDSLTPDYLSEIPKVVNKKYYPSIERKFKYEIWDHIPYHGCFIISYSYKKDGQTYRYDSRIDTVVFSGVGALYPERMDICIEHGQIEQLIAGVKSFYSDSLKYPPNIKQLVPNYLDSIPFDLTAQYRPMPDKPSASSKLFDYSCFQPSKKFRGEFSLSFAVTFGHYGYHKLGWYFDD